MSEIVTKLHYLPANRDEVTAQWLEQVIAGHSEFARDPIEAVTFESLGDGIGQMSELLRASVTRNSGHQHQLVIKLQTSVEGMRDIAIRYHHYLREANFYTLLAASVPIRTPKVFAAAFDQHSRRTALVMEHFGPSHYSPNQLAGASLAEIELAVDRLALLTAQFWDSSLQTTHRWMGNANADFYRSALIDYPADVDEAFARFGDGIPGGIAMPRKIGTHLADIHDYLCEDAQVLTHWDYRVENMIFSRSNPDDFVLLDWQLMMWMRPGWDFIYLVCTCMNETRRRVHLDALVDRYVAGLAARGVTNYSRARFETDMRMALMACSVVSIIGSAHCDMDNPRSAELFRTITRRTFTAIDELGCLDLLH